jgi:hypothetical protein
LSSAVRVACPHCLASLKLKSREMLGRRVTCPKCNEEFDAAEEDVELFQTTDTLSPTPLGPTISRGTRWQKKRSNRLRTRVSWFATAGVLAAIVVSAFFVPWSSLVAEINLNPFADTPDVIMKEEAPLLGEAVDLTEAALDGGPFLELAVKAKSLDDRVVALYLRALRVRPVSQGRLDSALERHRAEGEAYLERTRTLSLRAVNAGHGNGLRQASLADMAAIDDFKTSQRGAIEHLQWIQGTFKSMMERPPTPQSSSQKTEAEIIDILREVAVLISRVNSISAAQAIVPTLEQRAERIATLRERLAEEAASDSAQTFKESSAFLQIGTAVVPQIDHVTALVSKRYNLGSDLIDAVIKFGASGGAIQRGIADAQMRRGLPRLAVRSEVDAQPDEPPAKSATLSPAPILSDPAARTSTGPVAAKTPEEASDPDELTGPTEAPFLAPNTGPSGFVSKCVREFGKDHLTFVGFPDNGQPRQQFVQLMIRIQSVLGGIPSRWTINQGAIIAIVSSDTVDELAAKIHLGRVRKIDAAHRRIIIDLPSPAAGMSRDAQTIGPNAQPARRFPRGRVAPAVPTPAPVGRPSNVPRSSGL